MPQLLKSEILNLKPEVPEGVEPAVDPESYSEYPALTWKQDGLCFECAVTGDLDYDVSPFVTFTSEYKPGAESNPAWQHYMDKAYQYALLEYDRKDYIEDGLTPEEAEQAVMFDIQYFWDVLHKKRRLHNLEVDIAIGDVTLASETYGSYMMMGREGWVKAVIIRVANESVENLWPDALQALEQIALTTFNQKEMTP